MNTQQQANPPRVLLVEDDVTSQAFFHATLMALPATVDTAASLADARQLARANRHALWLIDANLPDGTGPELLRYLRTVQEDVPALAHTADTHPETRQALLQAGFDRVLLKPLAGSDLLASVREALGRAIAPAVEAPNWDEGAALQALNGQGAHVIALRELFMAELPETRAAVSSALQRDDSGALRSQLHRLQASCGFVGASRLGRAVRQLHQAPDSDMARRQFDAAVNALLHH